MAESRPGETLRAPSAWSALAFPIFRALWIASLVSNIGTWMQNVAAAWQMTTLTPSPLLVALMQTATALPIFLLALPAGAMADIVDLRRLLVVTQAWMLAAAAALGALSALGALTAPALLALTFLLGLGAALSMPAWQAMIPELVEPARLSSAVTMNGVSTNLARAVGPALGGLVVAAAGPGPAYFLNAASFLAVIAVVAKWNRRPKASVAPAERIWGAVRAGARYVRHAPEIQALLLRVTLFTIGASAYWSLLPLVAARRLGVGSSGYGLLLALFGLGAVAGAAVLPKVQAGLPVDRLVAATTALTAMCLAVMGFVRSFPAVAAAAAVAGACWMGMLSTMNVRTQTRVPAWVRARALALYVLALQGWLAVGSFLWGVVAERWGLPAAFAAAAGILLAGMGAVLSLPRFAVGSEELDFAPAVRWPDPNMVAPRNPEEGPVLVTVEYWIDPARSEEFLDAMSAVRSVRRRDGALQWGVFRDLARPGRFLETFLVESWAEHLRQHERTTVANRLVVARAVAFHSRPESPVVSHLIWGETGVEFPERAQGRTPED
jgi:MFS family permease